MLKSSFFKPTTWISRFSFHMFTSIVNFITSISIILKFPYNHIPAFSTTSIKDMSSNYVASSWQTQKDEIKPFSSHHQRHFWWCALKFVRAILSLGIVTRFDSNYVVQVWAFFKLVWYSSLILGCCDMWFVPHFLWDWSFSIKDGVRFMVEFNVSRILPIWELFGSLVSKVFEIRKC